jgi:hypothetical protein
MASIAKVITRGTDTKRIKLSSVGIEYSKIKKTVDKWAILGKHNYIECLIEVDGCKCGYKFSDIEENGFNNLSSIQAHIRQAHHYTKEQKLKQMRPATDAHLAAISTPEGNKKWRKIIKKSNSRPEVRKKISENTKKVMQTPGMWDKLSVRMLEIWSRPGYKDKMRDIHIKDSTERWKNKAFAKKQRLRFGSIENRTKVSEETKKAMQRPEVVAKIMAARKKKLEEGPYKAKGVRYIRKSKKTIKELADMYGVCRTAIQNIKNRKAFAWLK